MDENPYEAPTALADQRLRRWLWTASMVRLARFPLGAIAASGGMAAATVGIQLLNGPPAGIRELGIYVLRLYRYQWLVHVYKLAGFVEEKLRGGRVEIGLSTGPPPNYYS